MLSEKDLMTIREVVGPIAKEYHVKAVYLFGSRARGDNREGSDYDFIVVPDDKMSAFQFTGMMIKLEEAFESKIDLVSSRSMDDDFISMVDKDKVLVYSE